MHQNNHFQQGSPQHPVQQAAYQPAVPSRSSPMAPSAQQSVAAPSYHQQVNYGPPPGFRVAIPSARARQNDHLPPTAAPGAKRLSTPGENLQPSFPRMPPQQYYPPQQQPSLQPQRQNYVPSHQGAHSRVVSADHSIRYPSSPHAPTVANNTPSPRGNHFPPPSPVVDVGRVPAHSMTPSPRIQVAAPHMAPASGPYPTTQPPQSAVAPGYDYGRLPLADPLFSQGHGRGRSHSAAAAPQYPAHHHPAPQQAPPQAYQQQHHQHLHPTQQPPRQMYHSPGPAQHPSTAHQPVSPSAHQHTHHSPQQVMQQSPHLSHSPASRGRTQSVSRNRSTSRNASPSRKRVQIISDQVMTIAKEIGSQLNRTIPDSSALFKWLPGLTDEEMTELRAAYTKVPNSKGLALYKHIRTSFQGPLCRAFYATSLGQHRSNAYWLSIWISMPRSGTIRLDHDVKSPYLIMGALFGKTQDEIEEIESAYADLRSGENLLDALLKVFFNNRQYENLHEEIGIIRPPKSYSVMAAAISIVLTSHIQAETEVRSEKHLLTDRDALRHSVEEDDFLTVLKILLTRSKTHLRLVFQSYKSAFNETFMDQMLARSEDYPSITMMKDIVIYMHNLVASEAWHEALQLNDFIKSVRAAVGRSRSVSRARLGASTTTVSRPPVDLLMAKITNLHWDRELLAQTKVQYRKHYGKTVEDDVLGVISGEVGKYFVRLLRPEDDPEVGLEKPPVRGRRLSIF